MLGRCFPRCGAALGRVCRPGGGSCLARSGLNILKDIVAAYNVTESKVWGRDGQMSLAPTHDCSRAEGDAQDVVPVAAHSTGKKSVPKSACSVCTEEPLCSRGWVGGTQWCTQQGWYVPGDELFLSMGCACCGGARGAGRGVGCQGELGT